MGEGCDFVRRGRVEEVREEEGEEEVILCIGGWERKGGGEEGCDFVHKGWGERRGVGVGQWFCSWGEGGGGGDFLLGRGGGKWVGGGNV